MPNAQLLEYIKQNSPAFSRQELTQALLSAGWAISDIAAAFNSLEGQPASGEASGASSVPSGPDFLAEMEKRRKEAQASYGGVIVEGNTKITMGGQANSYLHSETSSKESGIVGMLIKAGVAKNAAQANLAMVVIIVICLLIVGFIYLA